MLLRGLLCSGGSPTAVKTLSAGKTGEVPRGTNFPFDGADTFDGADDPSLSFAMPLHSLREGRGGSLNIGKNRIEPTQSILRPNPKPQTLNPKPSVHLETKP
jgi:hypothetical protein